MSALTIFALTTVIAVIALIIKHQHKVIEELRARVDHFEEEGKRLSPWQGEVMQRLLTLDDESALAREGGDNLASHIRGNRDAIEWHLKTMHE